MNTRERLSVLNFQPFDRLPVVEWAPCGFDAKPLACGRLAGFGKTIRRSESFRADVWIKTVLRFSRRSAVAPSHGAGIIADKRTTNASFLPLHSKYGVNERTGGDCPGARAWRRGDLDHFRGFFWHPRTLLGIERHLYAFYDQPELIHRINNDLVEWQVRALDAMCAICTPVFMTFAEDLSI